MTGLSVSVARGVGGAGRCTVVRLAGEADVTTGVLGDVLRAEAAVGPRLLAVEVSGLSFMDSSALHVVIGVYRELVRAGRLLALVSPSGPVARVLELTGVGRVIPVFGSVEEAAAGLPDGEGAR